MPVTLRRLAALALFPIAAAAQITTAAERAESWALHQRLAAASPFRALTWRAAGPVKIGARIEAIAIPPGNTGTIYAGVGTGNLWKTVNNGITWRPIFEHQSTFAIGDVAVAQRDPNTVWVGTGEAQPRYAGYAYPGSGVFKSTDAGETWTNMGLGETHHIAKVAIHPSNPNVVFVAAMGHQWSHNRDRGVFRTTDGGRHWEQVLRIDDSTGVVDLAIDPVNPLHVYAWAWTIESGTSGGLFKSTDGGRTWRRVSRGLPSGTLGRAGIDVNARTPNVLYLFLDNRNASPEAGRPFIGAEVYRSDDHGETWRKVSDGKLWGVFTVYGWKFTDVRSDPRNANHLYILGNTAWQSFDGGRTFRRIGDRILRLHDTDGRALHLDHHDLVIDPSNPDRLLLGNDGGLFQSHDGGETWLHMNNIPVVQFYFITTDDREPYRIFGGTQDDAALYGPSTASLDPAVPDPWKSVYLDRWTGGDSYVTLPDPTDDRYVYYEHQYGEIMRMDITGASVMSGGPSTVNIRPKIADDSTLRFSWYTPFFISPHEPRTLYAAGNRVLKTIDRGAHWTAISPDLGERPAGDRATVPTGAFTMLAESPLTRGLLVGGTEGGGLWRTTNDGGTWTRLGTSLPAKWVSRVTLSSHDAGTIYVSMTGFREDDATPYVFVSSDTGTTWRSIASNLPREAINVIKEDPADASILYLGTDVGVYVSRDRGVRWESLSASLPTTPVHDLAVQSRAGELVLGSHGRGAWILDLAPVRAMQRVPATAALHLFPIRTAVADYFPWDAVPGDRRGRNVARINLAATSAGPATVAVSDSAGRVVRRWSHALVAGVNTVVWDLQGERSAGELRDILPGVYGIDVIQGRERASGSIVITRDPVLKRFD